MPLEGLRWSRDSGSTLCDTPQNGRSRTGWGGVKRLILIELYCFRVLLFLYYSFKSTTIFRNRQENRGKVLEKITFEGYCISHLSYMHFQISHSCLWIYLVQQSILFELCTSSYTFAMIYSNIHNKCSKNYKINPHGFFSSTFCPCSNYFCTFAAYTYCVHYK